MILPQSVLDFEGRWLLDRRIEDAKAGQVLLASGTALLHGGGQDWIYNEELQLSVPGQPAMTATRRYLWQAVAGAVVIRFEDGKHFHRLGLGQETASDHHDCPPDSYDAEYDFSEWPCWSVTWRVSGPRKSYVMRTRLSRAGD